MSNFLEQLVAEWYEHEGYFVRRNIQVGPRARGGYEGELDIVAFHPVKKRLVHVEPSMDSDNREKREQRFRRKFETGRKYIPQLFEGLILPEKIEQIALLVYCSAKDKKSLGGGQLVTIGAFMAEIRQGLQSRSVRNAAVPEQFTILRSLQFAANYWPES